MSAPQVLVEVLEQVLVEVLVEVREVVPGPGPREATNSSSIRHESMIPSRSQGSAWWATKKVIEKVV